MTLETEIGGGAAGWESTLWSSVLRAEPAEARPALERLALRYWRPIYFYLRRRGKDVETAKDLAQGFYCYLLEKDLLLRARPDQGSFRAYLRAILDRFVSDRRDHDAAAKRGGDAVRMPLDFVEAETEYAGRTPETPEEAFERTWAEDTIARVLEKFRKESPAIRNDVFRLRFGSGGLPYSEIARELGVPESDVTNQLHRGRTRLRELFVEELREGVSTAEELEAELRKFGSIL